MKINSNWIKDLNTRPETLKQLKEVVRNILEQLSIGNNFLDRTQKGSDLGERMNKWDCIKLKSFCTAKETVTIPVRMAIIKGNNNSKCLLGCSKTGAFIHCWWECKLVQPLWKAVWRLLKS
jgi:hypothetical protein